MTSWMSMHTRLGIAPLFARRPLDVPTLRAWDKVVAVAAPAACRAELDGGGVVGGGGTACLNVWSHGTWRHQGFGKMADSNCDPCQLC